MGSRVGVAVFAGVGVQVTVAVFVGVGMSVAVGVGVAVSVAVGVGEAVLVAVGICVGSGTKREQPLKTMNIQRLTAHKTTFCLIS